ncbi:HDOD domain-containing protein [Thermodesulfobacteriota bacterium]
MSTNLANIINVRLTPKGFFLEIADKETKLQLPQLLQYLNGLNIPNIQTPAVMHAYKQPRGKSIQIAPLPAAHPGMKQQARPGRKVVRWLRPLIKANTPVGEANSVLIVDTTQAMLKVIKTVYADVGLEISVASQPQAFFSAIAQKKPDLILLASQLGKVDGGLLSVKIRTDPRTKELPVVMYSSQRSRQEIIRQFDAGITDYLVMPVNAATLKAKIGAVLSQVGKNIKTANGAVDHDGAENNHAAPFDPSSITILNLTKKVKEVLAIPHVIERVLKISDDATSGARDLVLAIQTDAATVATVLKKANTVFYGKKEPISDIREAIVRIGQNEIKSLVLGMSVIKQFDKEQKTNGFNRQDFWKHSLATGVLARIFARQLKLHNPDDLFICGLLHDLGKMVLDEYANPPYDDIVMESIRSQRPLYQVEKEVLKFNHITVGRMILEQWKFPENLSLVASRHHSPEDKKKERARPQDLLQARLVYIANIMAKALGVGCSGDMSINELPLSPWVSTLQRLSLTPEVLDQFQKELNEVGSFLDIEGNIGESVDLSGDLLPQVLMVDSIQSVRKVEVTKTHLIAMGYPVESYVKASEVPREKRDKPFAFCVLLDNHEKLKGVLHDLKPHLKLNRIPVVVILPEEEKEVMKKNDLPERPDFLTDNQTLLFEPFDITQLHNGLEASSGGKSSGESNGKAG